MVSRLCNTNGARACKPISMRKLGLVREEGQTVDLENIEERVVTFGNQEYV